MTKAEGHGLILVRITQDNDSEWLKEKIVPDLKKTGVEGIEGMKDEEMVASIAETCGRQDLDYIKDHKELLRAIATCMDDSSKTCKET